MIEYLIWTLPALFFIIIINRALKNVNFTGRRKISIIIGLALGLTISNISAEYMANHDVPIEATAIALALMGIGILTVALVGTLDKHNSHLFVVMAIILGAFIIHIFSGATLLAMVGLLSIMIMVPAVALSK